MTAIAVVRARIDIRVQAEASTILSASGLTVSEIAALCRRFCVRRLDVFGSAATGAFDPATSDVDLLVSFDPAATDYAGCFFGLLEGLEALFGRPVDLVTEQSIANPYLRRQIMAVRRTLFRAGDGA